MALVWSLLNPHNQIYFMRRVHRETISLLYARGAQLTTRTNPGRYYAVHNTYHRESNSFDFELQEEKGLLSSKICSSF